MPSTMPRTMEIDHYLAACVSELVDDYGQNRVEEIARVTRQALLDLHGSIAAESLPEMVIRLARVRLGERQRG